MIENIFRHLGSHGQGTMKERILAGAREVAGPMTFSTIIIAVAFLPLFTMTGVSGVIFSPMARTYAFAIGGRDRHGADAHAGPRVEAHPRRRRKRKRTRDARASRVYRRRRIFVVRSPWLAGV